jgi:hypothetical protein
MRNHPATRRGGFGLVLVLAVLAVMGGAIASLAAQSVAIAYQTRRMHEDACLRNLQASALAWAARNASAGRARPESPATLDASALGVPGAKVTVGEGASDANVASVTVDCQWESHGRTNRSTARFALTASSRPPGE